MFKYLLEKVDAKRNDAAVSEPHKVALDELFKFLQGPKMKKDIPLKSNSFSEMQLQLRNLVPQLTMKELNTHSEVIPYKAGVLYVIGDKVHFAHGIPGDFAVLGMKQKYIQNIPRWMAMGSNAADMATINQFLFDLANRTGETLITIMQYAASGILNKAPPKKTLAILDQGGCGKTSFIRLVKNSAEGRYVALSFLN